MKWIFASVLCLLIGIYWSFTMAGILYISNAFGVPYFLALLFAWLAPVIFPIACVCLGDLCYLYLNKSDWENS